MEPTLYIGIDPGVSGAIGAVGPGGFVEVHPVPTIEALTGGKTKKGNPRKKRHYDEQATYNLLTSLLKRAEDNGWQVKAALEDVHAMPKDSKVGAFAFGEAKGLWRGMMLGRVPYRLVPPATWRVKLVGRGTDKNMSRVIAQRMYPTVALPVENDHNKAEALLIARMSDGSGRTPRR